MKNKLTLEDWKQLRNKWHLISPVIDMALAILGDHRLSPSEKMAAAHGWLQGCRRDIAGECLNVTHYPSVDWLHSSLCKSKVLKSDEDGPAY